jgi:hypothetical protein
VSWRAGQGGDEPQSFFYKHLIDFAILFENNMVNSLIRAVLAAALMTCQIRADTFEKMEEICGLL